MYAPRAHISGFPMDYQRKRYWEVSPGTARLNLSGIRPDQASCGSGLWPENAGPSQKGGIHDALGARYASRLLHAVPAPAKEQLELCRRAPVERGISTTDATSKSNLSGLVEYRPTPNSEKNDEQETLLDHDHGHCVSGRGERLGVSAGVLVP